MNKKLVSVSQYNEKGRLIARYPSIATAAKLTGTQPAHIGKVCNGKRSSAGGYAWKKFNKFRPILTNKNRGIVQYNPVNDSVVAVFNSVETAAALTGISESRINTALTSSKYVSGYSFFPA